MQYLVSKPLGFFKINTVVLVRAAHKAKAISQKTQYTVCNSQSRERDQLRTKGLEYYYYHDFITIDVANTEEAATDSSESPHFTVIH